MSDTSTIDSPSSTQRTDRIELIAAILLGIAAVLTAASAYRAALLDGDALKGYTESSKLETQAADQNSLGDQIQASDETIFLEYAILATEGDGTGEDAAAQRATYILETLARPELQEAIQWWAEQPEGKDSPPSPFTEDNPVYAADSYNPGWVEATKMIDEAEARFSEGEKADDQGDLFELATVFLAGTLFFAGIAVVFRSSRMPYVLLAISGMFLVLGSVQFVRAWTA